ncbi:hypothetical protein KQI63_11060 [bacterium]|nr:hypothetical protein [bacterium]
MKAMMIVLMVMALPLFAVASDAEPDTTFAEKQENRSGSFPIELLVETDVKQMLEQQETKMLLHKLMTTTQDRPQWIPAYSVFPRGDALDESRSLQAGLNFFSRSKRGEWRYFSPSEGFQLRTWERTPELLLDRQGARDFIISK